MAAEKKDEPKADGLTRVWLLLCIAAALATVVMQWGAFATESYVRQQDEQLRQELVKKIDKVTIDENMHYIELLKTMNEVKVILQDKQDRQDRKEGLQ
jgi:C4-dicarboxylate-specific signal transduction histidine kinase